MPRERAVPCRGATLQESIAGTHKTFNDNAICDRCAVLAARATAVARGEGEASARLGVSPSSELLLLDGSGRDRPLPGAVPAPSGGAL